MTGRADVVIIGAGIAGASLAWQLRGGRRVVLLEAEDSPSHHATGRSAAIMTPHAGAPLIRAASLASRGFLTKPPEGFCDVPLTSARGVLRLADESGREALALALAEGLALGRPLRMLSRPELAEMGLPVTAGVVCGLHDTEPRDIDVDALHRAFLRGSGADLRLRASVTGLDRSRDVWRVQTPQGTLEAPVVVNAAGAFADRVAVMAGLRPRGLEPRKRTIAHFDLPGIGTRHWPLIADPEVSFYVKPEGRGILLSPSDATPAEPGEIWPDNMDIAIAVDRMQRWLDLDPRRPSASWAGLRSSMPDDDPVAGWDPEAPGFFWFAGQGGFGIQSSPALSRAAAAILCGDPIPGGLASAGLTATPLSPARLDKIESEALA